MILFNDIASLVESKYTGIELSQDIKNTDIIVNPRHDNYRNKTLIINYSYNYVDLNKLSKYNNIISRIPLDIDNYEFEPYDLSKNIELKKSTDKLGILTPYYFNRDLISNDMEFPEFIISTNLYDNNYLNIAGLILNKLNLKCNSYKELCDIHNELKTKFSIITLSDSTKLKNFNQFNYLESPTIDISTDNISFTGPSVVIRTPNKRMNVKTNYIVSKFKTYRITDSFRSYNIRFNTIDGFYLFEPVNRELNDKCVEKFENSQGFDICLYFLYYFCRKNHFKCITGDIFTDTLKTLEDKVKGKVDLNLTLYPIENAKYDPNVFNLSIFGNNRYNKNKIRDYLTF